MADSKLVNYENYTVNKTQGRNGMVVDTITIHCTAGNKNSPAKNTADYFANPARKASSTYVVGGDGSVAQCVKESHRPWTTGGAKTVCGETGSKNDYHAITIEVASDTTGKEVNDCAIEKTIQLCVDIMQRFGKNKAVWFGDDAQKMVLYVPQPNEMKFTWHRWFDYRACPGEALMAKFEYIIGEINRRLGNVNPSPIKKEYNTKEEFVEVIAKYVQEIAPKFEVRVASPIIAQAILESGYGTSYKAQFNNFFGLKFRPGRVSCNVSTFTDGGSEQKTDGSYVNIESSWYAFKDARDGVQGYFEFTNIERYKNLKNVYDPYEYIRLIKEDGYATSLSYVDNLTRVIKENNLERFDSKEQPTEVWYEVKKSDTLSSIARKYGTSWPKLYEKNYDIIGKDPNKIYPGMKLRII